MLNWNLVFSKLEKPTCYFAHFLSTWPLSMLQTDKLLVFFICDITAASQTKPWEALQAVTLRAALKAAATSRVRGCGEALVLAKKQCGRNGSVGVGHAVCCVALGAWGQGAGQLAELARVLWGCCCLWLLSVWIETAGSAASSPGLCLMCSLLLGTIDWN